MFSGKREYRVWVKGRKNETECSIAADTALQAQMRMAAVWSVKSFKIECVWKKPATKESRSCF